jgi:hypothetical protein
MQLTEVEKNRKIQYLLDNEGFESEEAIMEQGVMDSVILGICVNDGCNYTTDVECDSTDGWCECCEENSVVSAAALVGLF